MAVTDPTVKTNAEGTWGQSRARGPGCAARGGPLACRHPRFSQPAARAGREPQVFILKSSKTCNCLILLSLRPCGAKASLYRISYILKCISICMHTLPTYTHAHANTYTHRPFPLLATLFLLPRSREPPAQKLRLQGASGRCSLCRALTV